MTHGPERGEQVEARIQARLETVFAAKIVDHRPGWFWGWYDSSRGAKITAFRDVLERSGLRFADCDILGGSRVVDMTDALATLTEHVEELGHASDRGAAIAKAAAFLRYMLPRYVLVTDNADMRAAADPDQLAAALDNAESRAAERWTDGERKRRSKEWQETHDKLPPEAVRTWQDDDWREQP